jgi:N-acetylmuramoyl-L-alanine amidase
VLVDPGHGGEAAGCTGNGLVEKDIVCHIADQLCDALSGVAGLTVERTRWSDETMPLDERGACSRVYQADLVAVIHADTNPDLHAGFLKTYHLKDDPVAAIVAASIERCAPCPLTPPLIAPVIANEDDWTARAFNVLANHGAAHHPVLIEVAFLSNPRHAAFLRDPYGLASIAAAIAGGILRGAVLLKGDH